MKFVASTRSLYALALRKYGKRTLLPATALVCLLLVSAPSAALMHLTSSHTIGSKSGLSRPASANFNPASRTATTTQTQSSTPSRTPANTTGTKLPPYDPRNTGALQPSPDKPAIPKTEKPLSFSSPTVTIYKNVNNAKGVKDGITETTVTVSTADGRSLYYPASSGSFLLTATSFNPRPMWTMTVSSSYASIGTTDIKVSAVAVDGSANYTGTLRVNVLPLPTFSIATSSFYTMNHYYDPNFIFWDFSGITYSSGSPAADAPTLSVQGPNGMSFTNVGYSGNNIHFAATTTLDTTASPLSLSLVFQNTYQLITIPVTVSVLNY